MGQKERDDFLPASVGKEMSFGSKRNRVKIELTPEQHDYMQEKASTFRMMLATPYIMSENFKTDKPEERNKILKSYYKQGLDMAKEGLVEKYYKEIEEKVQQEIKNKAEK